MRCELLEAWTVLIHCPCPLLRRVEKVGASGTAPALALEEGEGESREDDGLRGSMADAAYRLPEGTIERNKKGNDNIQHIIKASLLCRRSLL